MDWLNNFIDDFWSNVSDFFSSEDEGLLYYTFEIIGSFFNLILQWISYGWSFLFDNLISFFYSIFFSNYEGTVNTGKYAVDSIFSFQNHSTSLFSVDMIYFFFGCVIMVFIFKFVLKIVLQLVGMLR